MNLDLWFVYRHMLRSRLFEAAVTALWEQGLIYYGRTAHRCWFDQSTRVC